MAESPCIIDARTRPLSFFFAFFAAFFSSAVMAETFLVSFESITGKSLMNSVALMRFVAGNLVANSNVTPEETSSAHEFINSIGSVFDEYFERHDLLLTPVSPNAGLRIDEMGTDTEYSEEAARKLIGIMKFTAAINFSDCPAMSAPLTWNSDAGLPIGAHFIAARGNGRMLYELAYELEEAPPWRNMWAPHSLKYAA